MTRRFDLLRRFGHVRAADGQTMAEYAVALSVISAAVIAVLGAFAGGIEGGVDRVVDLFADIAL